MGEFITVTVDEAVATIRLDRPPMNPISSQVQEELRLAAIDVDARDDVRAVVIYGGEKIFAAGADIKDMVDVTYPESIERSTRIHAAFNAVAAIRKPVIAAINGYALGGGCELALACDLRVAADNATLGQPEILLGIIPGAGGTQRLARLVGPARAKDLIFTGRFVKADEAYRIGLVDRVVPAEDVYSTAIELATSLARGPMHALRAAKDVIERGLDVDITTGLELERAAFAACFATEDQKIGMTSFIEHGPGKATFTRP